MTPEILTETFPLKESNSNIRNRIMLHGRSTKTVMFDSKYIYSLGLKRSYVLPTELKKNCVSYITQKEKIRNWILKNCPCRLCIRYVQNIEFL